MSALDEYNAHRSWTKQRGQEYVRGDFSDAAINELLAESESRRALMTECSAKLLKTTRRAEAAEKLVYDLSIERDDFLLRAQNAEAENEALKIGANCCHNWSDTCTAAGLGDRPCYMVDRCHTEYFHGGVMWSMRGRQP